MLERILKVWSITSTSLMPKLWKKKPKKQQVSQEQKPPHSEATLSKGLNSLLNLSLITPKLSLKEQLSWYFLMMLQTI